MMRNIDSIFNKKKVLIVTGLISVAVIIWDRIGNYSLCHFGGIQSYTCPFILSRIEIAVFFFLPVFFFSLITFWLKEDIFTMWIRFAIPWLLVFIVASFITPDRPSGIAPSPLGYLVFIYFAGAVGVSIALILIKSIEVYRKR